MTNFKVGQKVVCIDDHFEKFQKKGIILPVKGRIYTIRDLVQRDGKTGVLLVEIKNRLHDTRLLEFSFATYHFRPLEFDGDAVSEILEKFAPVEEKIDTQIPVEAHI